MSIGFGVFLRFLRTSPTAKYLQNARLVAFQCRLLRRLAVVPSRFARVGPTLVRRQLDVGQHVGPGRDRRHAGQRGPVALELLRRRCRLRHYRRHGGTTGHFGFGRL
uniref:(northern house mosquito) hypothetical protein n=1 Tax=Culex pipiens TaxID=7175 RepID=A0A8D8P7E9_CULPI